MTTTLALLDCLILAALALFQAALIAGAPIGKFAWGGQHAVLPARLRIGSIVAIGLYAVFAVIILQRAGTLAALPEAVAQIGIWVVAGYLGLGVAMNAISRSRSERLLMTPAALLLFGLTLAVALSPWPGTPAG